MRGTNPIRLLECHVVERGTDGVVLGIESTSSSYNGDRMTDCHQT